MGREREIHFDKGGRGNNRVWWGSMNVFKGRDQIQSKVQAKSETKSGSETKSESEASSANNVTKSDKSQSTRHAQALT